MGHPVYNTSIFRSTRMKYSAVKFRCLHLFHRPYLAFCLKNRARLGLHVTICLMDCLGHCMNFQGNQIRVNKTQQNRNRYIASALNKTIPATGRCWNLMSSPKDLFAGLRQVSSFPTKVYIPIKFLVVLFHQRPPGLSFQYDVISLRS